MEASDGATASVVNPFAPFEHYVSGLDSHPDDYEWLGYALDDKVDNQVGDQAVSNGGVS